MIPPQSVQLALMNEEETIFNPRDLHDNSGGFTLIVIAAKRLLFYIIYNFYDFENAFKFVDVFLSARRYASAGTSYGPVSVSVSLRLSVTSRCFIKRQERINLVLVGI